jgi:hypothetical protein
MQISSISNLENHIAVTDASDRNYSIPVERKAAFEKWHEELFGEGLDREDDWEQYLCASECASNGDDPSLPPIKWTYALLPDAQGRCYYIPREKEHAFTLWVAAVKNGKLEQYVQNGGQTFEDYAGARGRDRFFRKPRVN